jgi:hypothetical protein
MPHIRPSQGASRRAGGSPTPSLRAQRSNPRLRKPCYGLLRGACHRARIRATRWLAMTDTLLLLRPIGPTGKSPKVCPPLRTKIFRLPRRANQCSFSARLTADEGRVAIVTNVAVRCGGREACARRKRVTRTAKSCGPDAAVLASSRAEVSARRRWQKRRSPGRARSKP